MTTLSPLRMGSRWHTHNDLFHPLRLVGVPSPLVRLETLVRHLRLECDRILKFVGKWPAGGEPTLVGDGFAELGSPCPWQQPERFASGRLPLHLDKEWRRKLPLGPARAAGRHLAAAALHGYLRAAHNCPGCADPRARHPGRADRWEWRPVGVQPTASLTAETPI